MPRREAVVRPLMMQRWSACIAPIGSPARSSVRPLVTPSEQLLVAESLIESDGLDEADLFGRFRRWAEADPPDIGNQTRSVLGCGLPWDVAAAEHFARFGRAAGNGSLMRTTPAAIWFSRFGNEATMDAARRISALTHGDPAAGEGCAIFHELMQVALDGGDPLAAVVDALDLVDEKNRDRWATVLAPSWTPADATESN